MVCKRILQAWTQLSTQAYTKGSLSELCYGMVPTRTQLPERTVSRKLLDIFNLFKSDTTSLKTVRLTLY